jgi:hypothetical protein
VVAGRFGRRRPTSTSLLVAASRYCCPVRLRPHTTPRCRHAPAHAQRSLAWIRRHILPVVDG